MAVDPPRDRRAPLIALALLAVALTVTATILLWISSDWRYKANTFYSTNSSVQLTQEEYEVIDRMSYSGYQLFLLSTPLFMGAMVAVLGILGVLAWRWERKPVVATQATAASRV
jgi:hypothetical protein